MYTIWGTLVTSGWCMFYFITFKIIYLYSKGVKGNKLIYFYDGSDFKLRIRSLTHWVALDRTRLMPSCSLLMFSVKILPGERKSLFLFYLLFFLFFNLFFFFGPSLECTVFACWGWTLVKETIWTKDVGLYFLISFKVKPWIYSDCFVSFIIVVIISFKSFFFVMHNFWE